MSALNELDDLLLADDQRATAREFITHGWAIAGWRRDQLRATTVDLVKGELLVTVHPNGRVRWPAQARARRVQP